METLQEDYKKLYTTLDRVIESTMERQKAIQKIMSVGASLLEEHRRGFYNHIVGVNNEINTVPDTDAVVNKEGFELARQQGQKRLKRKQKLVDEMMKNRFLAGKVILQNKNDNTNKSN